MRADRRTEGRTWLPIMPLLLHFMQRKHEHNKSLSDLVSDLS
jgi:hypothetical protein